MEILAWMLVGLIVGLIAKSTVKESSGRGWVLFVILGVAGAMVSGSLVNMATVDSRENLLGFLPVTAPVSGAVAVLLIFRVFYRYR